MKKVGQVLSEARTSKHISLEHIAAETHIKLEFLQAIEKNEFAQLPPIAFVRGFLKQYAQVVGVEPQTVLALLRRDFAVSKTGNIIPRDLARSKSASLWFTPRIFTGIAVAMLVAMILAFVWLQWWRLQQPPELVVRHPEDEQTVEKTFQVIGKTTLDAIVFVNDQPVALNPDGTFIKELTRDQLGEFTISVKAMDRKQRTSSVERRVNVE